MFSFSEANKELCGCLENVMFNLFLYTLALWTFHTYINKLACGDTEGKVGSGVCALCDITQGCVPDLLIFKED